MNVVTRQMTLAHIAVTGYVAGAFDRMKKDDRGQGSVEYVGIVLIVAAIVAAVILFVKDDDGSSIGQAILDKVKTAIEGMKG